MLEETSETDQCDKIADNKQAQSLSELKSRMENATIKFDIARKEAAVSMASKYHDTPAAKKARASGLIQPLPENFAWNKLPRAELDEFKVTDLLASEADSSIGGKQYGNDIERSLFHSDLSWLDYSASSSSSEEPLPGKLLTIECFGGCARLTKALNDEGFEATSIDWLRNQSRPVGSSVLLDLTTEAGRIVLHKALRSGNVVYIHFAPPCGTASLARNIPLDAEATAAGMATPIPLRSEQYPNGFPWLQSMDKKRCDLANLLYKLTASSIRIAQELGISWSVENPRSSWFWKTTFMRDLTNHLISIGKPALWCEFQNCCYGGDRPKWSAFMHNVPGLMELQINGRCKGDHEHKPWGVIRSPNKLSFATTSEAAYPVVLCTTIAKIIGTHVRSKGAVLVPRLLEAAGSSLTGQVAAESGRQSRGQKAPRLIDEYACTQKYVAVAGGFDHVLADQVLQNQVVTSSGTIPTGARIRRTQTDAMGNRVIYASIPWSKAGFLDKAKTLTHPVDSSAFLGDDIYSNIFFVLTHSPAEVMAHRDSQLEVLKEIVKNFRDEEAEIHKNLPAEIERVVSGKNVLAFEQVLKVIRYRDVKVARRIFCGFQLSGFLEDTNEFAKRIPKNLQPVSKQDLLTSSCWSRHIIASKVCSSNDREMDEEIHRITKEENEAGWLIGPFSTDELDAKFDKRWIASPRFGVRQSNKIRPIDNFSIHGQNTTVSANETIPLGGVDAIMCLAKWAVGSVSEDRTIRVPDGKGSWLEGVLHPGWSTDSARTIMGQCIDLKAAYKEVPRDSQDAAISVIATWNPFNSSVELYESIALPFGSTGSVFGFNRFSYALRKILIRMFACLVTSFFDDFPVTEFQELAEHTSSVILKVFDLLGWKISTDKIKPFSQVFDAIGVQFDSMGLTTGGSIVVSNTRRRRDAIVSEIDGYLQSMFIASHEAASLKGRMLYGEAQHWGRVLSLTTRHLSIRSAGGGCGIVTGELFQSLIIARWLISNASPRMLHPWTKEKCNLIYVDAAANDSHVAGNQIVTVGGVLFSDRLTQTEYFGFEVSEEIVAHWQSSGSKQVVGQGELFPVWLAKKVWKEFLSHARNIFSIDNESAKEACIRSYSPSWSSREILLVSKLEDMKSSSLDWYARVPTAANWADGPSRLQFNDVEEIGAKKVCMTCPELREFSGVDVLRMLQS